MVCRVIDVFMCLEVSYLCYVAVFKTGLLYFLFLLRGSTYHPTCYKTLNICISRILHEYRILFAFSLRIASGAYAKLHSLSMVLNSFSLTGLDIKTSTPLA